MKGSYFSPGILILLLSMQFQTRAQLSYSGGTGGGSSVSLLTGLLENIQLTGLYAGGSGRGDNRNYFLSVFENPATKAVYNGGIGNGYFLFRVLAGLPNDKIAPLYKGGKGRGDSSSQTYRSILVSPASIMYRGGKGRGDSLVNLIGYLKTGTASEIYAGGRGRGDVTISSFAPLQTPNSLIYAGGPGRGDHSFYFEGDLIDVSNTRQIIVTADISGSQFSASAKPNPSSNYFTLDIKGRNDAAIRLRITDAVGKLMQEKIIEGGTQQIQLGDNWKNGTYFLEVIQGSDRKVIRLLKIK